MLDLLLKWDTSLFLFLNGHHFEWLDRPMWLFSTRWFWVPVYCWMLWLLQRRYGWKQFAWMVVFIALSVLINDQLASGLFKEWVGRPRPTYTEGISTLVHTVRDSSGAEYRGGKYGFYSSHTANLFGVAILFVFWMRPMRNVALIALYGWVSLVAYSRIYLGVHFPLDILAGVLMGSAMGYLVYRTHLRYFPIKPVR